MKMQLCTIWRCHPTRMVVRPGCVTPLHVIFVSEFEVVGNYFHMGGMVM